MGILSLRVSDFLTIAYSWAPFIQLDCSTLIFYIFFCHVWLLSHRNLFPFNERQKKRAP